MGVCILRRRFNGKISLKTVTKLVWWRMQLITVNKIVSACRGKYKERIQVVRYKLVIQLAKRGVADAQAILGAMYSKGIGVDKDNRKALTWYHLAADQGNVSAQFIIGIRYGLGEGVDRNHKKAFQWCCKAAAQNNPRAQAVLGVIYAQGEGVQNSEHLAYNWFLEAYEKRTS